MLASVISLAKNTLRLQPDAMQVLQTPEGVEALLVLMSVPRGGYDYIAPWLMLSEDFWGDWSDVEADSQTKREAYVRGRTMNAFHQIR
jgi:hypothetical protein